MIPNTGPWVESWLSPERFSRYLRLAGSDRERAIRLYVWTANLNASLLTDFAHLEVGLRNKYDQLLQPAAQHDSHWLYDTTMCQLFPNAKRPDGGPGPDARTHRDVRKAWELAGGKGKAAPGKVLAELTFGFWVLMTSHRHESRIWNEYLLHAYPSGSERYLVHQGLNDLRIARNRIAHHEPTDRPQANNISRQIRAYAKYISPELADFISDNSTVKGTIRNRP